MKFSRYKGFRDTPDITGLLFVEASHGNLQKYIDENNGLISLPIRKKWCRQLTEAIQHLHGNGVIHSDLRPENCLLDASAAPLDLLLCDFGGSMCRDLGLDGRGLPDPPFWNMEWESTPATDIFGLGSTFYTIMTGHWPYKSVHPSEQEEDKWDYEERVMTLLKDGVYPNVDGVIGGTVIMGCWRKRYIAIEHILQVQNMEMNE